MNETAHKENVYFTCVFVWSIESIYEWSTWNKMEKRYSIHIKGRIHLQKKRKKSSAYKQTYGHDEWKSVFRNEFD